MNVRILLFILMVFLCRTPLSAAEGEEKVESLKEERTKILLYGIDSQVSDLIDSLKTEKDTSYSDTLKEILISSANARLKVKILDFFSDTNYTNAYKEAAKLLGMYEDTEEEVVLSLIRYLADYQDNDVLDLFIELADHERDSIAIAAIGALGKSKDAERAGKRLLELFEDDEVASSRKQNILLAFGELRYEPARETLIEIVSDPDEDKVMRWYSCDALGKIANRDDIPVIKKLLSDKDEILKSYAVSALSRYEGDEVDQILITSLRESSPKIRINATKTLGERKVRDAVPILIFKAEKDPEPKVREEALSALGSIGGRDAYEFLASQFSKDTTPNNLRIIALKGMLNIDPADAIKAAETLIAKEWNAKDSKILDAVCQELSLRENGALEKTFSLMLTHPSSVTIQIYGIRGIVRNKFRSQKPAIEELSKNSKSSSVKKTALSALEEL